MQLCAEFLTQHVNRHRAAFGINAPERPAVTRGQVLHVGAHLMDRAFEVDEISVPSARTRALWRRF